jgi:hypothetical protein
MTVRKFEVKLSTFVYWEYVLVYKCTEVEQ